jgi:drug/metabolite transporter (DMT)-like permease
MNPRLGIALGVTGYFFFGLQDASNKWLVASLPVWEVLFVRSVVIVTLCCAFGRLRLIERVVATPVKRSIAMRAGLTLSAWLIYYTAARSLPLAQLLTLYFAAPLMITAMAGPVLGERVTRMQWASVAIGFIGVMVASDPFAVRLSLPTLMVLIAASLWAMAMILTRRIARRESSMVQMLAVNLIFAVVTGALCLAEWRAPDALSWGLLIAVGVLGGLGQYFIFEAVRRAPASVMAPVEYSALLWAFILGFVVWGDVPVAAVWAGAGLIVVAGVVLVAGERRVPA